MSFYLYAGTYTGGEQSDHVKTKSKGIYAFEMDSVTGELANIRAFGQDETDPGYIAIRGRFLFSENECKNAGVVRAFYIEDDGSLTLTDSLSTEGSKCAFVQPDLFGDYVFATNYASGSVMVIQSEQGKLTLTDQVQHYGKSIVPIRQDYPRAHSIKQTPDGNGVLVPDLGIDRVMNYLFDRKTGRLKPNPAQPYVSVKPGEGPRHLVFHPNGRFVYVNTEIGNHIYAYKYIAENHTLEPIQKISLIPKDFCAENHAAEIIITASGDFIYVSNRGQDKVVCFKVDSNTGLLQHIGWFDCGGKGPRHICLSPEEDFIFCANKDSDTITVINRDITTGALMGIPYTYSIPAPSCVAWTKL